MPILSWQESFCTGFPVIDDQHKQIFATLNQLHDAFQNGASRKELGQILDSLITCNLSHFKTEEALMEDGGYPDLEQHRMEHDHLVRKLQDLKRTFSEPEPPSVVEFSKFVSDWLHHHLAEVDAGYVNHLRSKRNAPSNLPD